MEATTKEAYQLMHDGAIALAEVQHNGIHIDLDYVNRQMDSMQEEIQTLEQQFMQTELGNAWKRTERHFKKKVKLTNDTHLRHALYTILKVESTKETDKGDKSVDAATLKQIDIEGVDTLLRWRKIQKAKDTFLAQVKRETVNNYVHPFFNLHLVTTYRSSSDSPNFQNVPKRDKEIQEMIRRAFIPRPGHHLLEVDYSGVEVRTPCFYHSDPTLMAYVQDKTKDMHRDTASQNYKLDATQVTKEIRHVGKNECVFPWFYGDWPGSTGPTMFVSAKSLKLKNGIRLSKHLKTQGIGTEAAFIAHHKKVYDDFWEHRFKVYAKWKEQVWREYEKHGYVQMLTGFKCSDIAIYNEVINRPIQGTAFHMLLWSLIQVQRELKARGLKTKLIGQIHDSLVLDVAPDEINTVMRLVRNVMTKRIREHWQWINVPLEVEAELSPKDGSWFEIKEIIKDRCNCGSNWKWKESKQCPICMEHCT